MLSNADSGQSLCTCSIGLLPCLFTQLPASIPRSYLNETLLDPKKTYIFVEFPHGVYPMSEVRAPYAITWGVCVTAA